MALFAVEIRTRSPGIQNVEINFAEIIPSREHRKMSWRQALLTAAWHNKQYWFTVAIWLAYFFFFLINSWVFNEKSSKNAVKLVDIELLFPGNLLSFIARLVYESRMWKATWNDFQHVTHDLCILLIGNWVIWKLWRM